MKRYDPWCSNPGAVCSLLPSELEPAQGDAADHRALRKEEEDDGGNGQDQGVGHHRAGIGDAMVEHELVDAQRQGVGAGVVQEDQRIGD